MPQRGRPRGSTKLTPEVQERILQAIELGASYKHAAKYGGVEYETLWHWMRHKTNFSHAVRASEGKAVLVWLAKIEKAASDGEWRAAAWKLERLYPEDFGDKVQVQHSGHVDVQLAVRQIQAALDDVLPNDPTIRRRFAQKVIELDRASSSSSSWDVEEAVS